MLKVDKFVDFQKSIRSEGLTPSGGAYAIAYFYDKDGYSCSKQEAVRCIINEFDENDKVIHSTYGNINGKSKIENKYYANSEYVMSNSNKTRILYSDTIELTFLNTGKTVRIKSKNFLAGRDQRCGLRFDGSCTYIARIHAAFFHEHGLWFVTSYGLNGTYLNDVKMKHGKKYELIAGDIINFAQSEKLVFYDTEKLQVKADRIKKIDIGTLIDSKYVILKLNGIGGNFKVYLAKNIRDGKVCSIAVYDKDKSDMRYFKTLIQDANRMMKLDHPGLSRIIDVFVEENYIAVVREYTLGETLESILRCCGAQPEDKAVIWGKQICDVLIYLHSFNPPYIYGDVKPQSLFLTTNGFIKLYEFVAHESKQSDNTIVFGTPGYAAPEQYDENEQLDARTDIFSLGMTLFQIVTGEPPQNQCPIRQINPNLSVGLEYIINKCTQLDPKNRYQSCTELLHDLNRYQDLFKQKGFFRKKLKLIK